MKPPALPTWPATLLRPGAPTCHMARVGWAIWLATWNDGRLHRLSVGLGRHGAKCAERAKEARATARQRGARGRARESAARTDRAKARPGQARAAQWPWHKSLSLLGSWAHGWFPHWAHKGPVCGRAQSPRIAGGVGGLHAGPVGRLGCKSNNLEKNKKRRKSLGP